MKKQIPVSTAFAIFAVLVIAGCSTPGGPSTSKSGSPAKVNISGAKGLYLQTQAAKSIRVARALSGKFIVSATSATLGQITSSGIPETATFTDDTGVTVTVTIKQAMQLTSGYVLLAYTCDAGSGTGILDMPGGTLANLATVPDNWANVYSANGSMYYEASGAIYRATLSDGSTATLSTGAALYGNNGTGTLYGSGNQPDPLVQASAAWDSKAWIYADSAGNAYALDLTPSGFFLAAAFPAAGGAQVDFGSNAFAYFFTSWLPTGSTGTSNEYAAIDSSTGDLYLVLSHDLWDGNPYSWGGQNITGVAFQIYLVSMSPTGTSNNGPVMSFTPGSPAAAFALTSTYWPMTHVGFGYALQTGVYTKGAETLIVSLASGTTITDYDTSAVPVQSSGPGQVGNWQWSGGQLYAGPATAQSIGIVKFNGSTGTATQLVSDSSTIVSWSVVGGILFYTDGTGTYQATVNAAAGTISTPVAYTGGTVQAVTQ